MAIRLRNSLAPSWTLITTFVSAYPRPIIFPATRTYHADRPRRCATTTPVRRTERARNAATRSRRGEKKLVLPFLSARPVEKGLQALGHLADVLDRVADRLLGDARFKSRINRSHRLFADFSP